MKTKIGERFRIIRRERGWSQAKMAEVIGLSARYYQEVESGRSDPSSTITLHAIEVLKVSFSEFFGEQETKADLFYRLIRLALTMDRDQLKDLTFLASTGATAPRRIKLSK